jgi:DNA-binding transcriptional LysR family regulator
MSCARKSAARWRRADTRRSPDIAYTCNDTLSMISLVAAGVGVAFLPQWVEFMPKQNFCLKKVRGIDMRISLGLAWNESDPVANWDEIFEIARSFVK